MSVMATSAQPLMTSGGPALAQIAGGMPADGDLFAALFAPIGEGSGDGEDGDEALPETTDGAVPTADAATLLPLMEMQRAAMAVPQPVVVAPKVEGGEALVVDAAAPAAAAVAAPTIATTTTQPEGEEAAPAIAADGDAAPAPVAGTPAPVVTTAQAPEAPARRTRSTDATTAKVEGTKTNRRAASADAPIADAPVAEADPKGQGATPVRQIAAPISALVDEVSTPIVAAPTTASAKSDPTDTPPPATAETVIPARFLPAGAQPTEEPVDQPTAAQPTIAEIMARTQVLPTATPAAANPTAAVTPAAATAAAPVQIVAEGESPAEPAIGKTEAESIMATEVMPNIARPAAQALRRAPLPATARVEGEAGRVSRAAPTAEPRVAAPVADATLQPAAVLAADTVVQQTQQTAAIPQPQPATQAIGNAGSVAAAPTLSDQIAQQTLDMSGGSAWLDQLSSEIGRIGSGEGKLDFRLTPQALGELRVQVSQSDAGAHVRMTATTEQAQAALSDAQSRLVSDARAQGVRIAETQVDLAGSRADTMAQQQQQQNQQAAAQQQAQAGQPRIVRPRGGDVTSTINQAAPRTARASDRYA